MSFNDQFQQTVIQLLSFTVDLEKIHYSIRTLLWSEVFIFVPAEDRDNIHGSEIEKLFRNIGLSPSWILLPSADEPIWAQIEPVLALSSRLMKKKSQICINLEFRDLIQSLAIYILGSYLDAKMYVIRNNPPEIVEVPALPLKNVDPVSKDFLILLSNMGGESPSLKETVRSGTWESKAETSTRALAQASYFVRKLEKDGLVQTFRDGKELRVKLTGSGFFLALLNKEEIS
ncbi:MAG: hypothetical protein ACFFD4_31275 [Candidatus Odinarchaeota archaeon]